MRKNLSIQAGFTIVELVIAMGIFAILTSLITVNLLNVQHVASIESVTTTLIADIKQQQIKAMSGDTEGKGYKDEYGVHFDNNKYVLFHGTYSSTEASNFEIPLEGSLTFTGAAIPGNIIFNQGNGENSGVSEVTLTDTLTGKNKTIHINTLGVITDVD